MKKTEEYLLCSTTITQLRICNPSTSVQTTRPRTEDLFKHDKSELCNIGGTTIEPDKASLQRRVNFIMTAADQFE